MHFLQKLMQALSIFFLPSMFLIKCVYAQPVVWGITGGFNVSSHINNFRYSEADIDFNLSPNITSNFQAGMVVRKSLSPSFSLQIEPSIITLGAHYDETFMLRGFEFNTSSRTKLLYLHLPLLLQISTVPHQSTVYGRTFAKTTYHLTSGVFGGYLLDADFTGTNTGNPVGIPFEGDFSNNVKSQYSNYDGGLIIGVGFEHGYKHKIGFETRAQYSMVNSGNTSEFSFRPRNIAITISVYFLL